MDKIAPDAANLSNTSNNQDDIIYNIASSGQITLRADLGDPASIVTTQGVKAIGTISQSDVVKLYQKVAGTADSNFQEVASRTLTSSDMDAGKFDFVIDAPTSDAKYEYRTKLFDDHGNESATYGGEIDVVVDKTAPGVPTVAVSKGLIAEATSDVTLTVTLPSGTEAGEKVELYTFASNTYTPVSGHVAGAAKVVSGPEAPAVAHNYIGCAKIPDDASTDFRIKLTDNAGNITPSASFSITSDNTAPQVTAIARPSSETIDTNATSVKFEVTTSEDVKVTEVTGTDFVVTLVVQILQLPQ